MAAFSTILSINVIIVILCCVYTPQVNARYFPSKRTNEIPNYTYHTGQFVDMMDRLKRQIWAGWSPIELKAPEDITSDYSDVLGILLEESEPPSKTWQPPAICGVRQDDEGIRRGRIVAGIQATNRWPWQVQLYNISSGQSACGGTLISEEYVVTAAHCIKGFNFHNELLVRVGELDTSMLEGFEQDFEMECVHIHKGYVAAQSQNPVFGNIDHYANDIALIKLRTSPDNYITISSHVMPACLPEKNEFKPGAECFITGWGYTDFAEYLYDLQPEVLHEARVPLIRNSECKRLDIYRAKLNPKKFCAGHLTGPHRPDTCKKDSGGPLVCKDGNNRWKLWGVTSEGENTFCEDNPSTATPGIYTKVDKYLYWLKKRMTSSKCPPVPLVSGARRDVFPPRPVRSPS